MIATDEKKTGPGMSKLASGLLGLTLSVQVAVMFVARSKWAVTETCKTNVLAYAEVLKMVVCLAIVTYNGQLDQTTTDSHLSIVPTIGYASGIVGASIHRSTRVAYESQMFRVAVANVPSSRKCSETESQIMPNNTK